MWNKNKIRKENRLAPTDVKIFSCFYKTRKIETQGGKKENKKAETFASNYYCSMWNIFIFSFSLFRIRASSESFLSLYPQ
jgi:hypothetical protein